MPTQRERVLDFLARFPGRDDDEISSALSIRPRQTINMLCRRLADEGLLRRGTDPRSGKIVNTLNSATTIVATNKHPAASSSDNPSTCSAQSISEDEVKAALALKLTVEGWSVDVAWGKARGIDIVAKRGVEKWVIECKGSGSLAPMKNNYFVGVIGELAQRMSDQNAKHSVAFPDHPKYRRLWTELPAHFKQRLGITVLFVDEGGKVNELA